MKKIICLLTALMMCMSFAAPVFATSGEFVPSITYKDVPEVEDATMNGEGVSDCIIVSSITDAKEKNTDISQEARDLLIEVYEKLSDGSMELPLDEGEYVIRELVDVSFKENDCVLQEHGKVEWLEEEGNTVSLTFDLDVKGSTTVTVFVYVDGQWVRVEDVTNNGDGSITCVFEKICPVAFCVEKGAEEDGPATGDDAAADLMLWGCLMTVSMAAIVVLGVNRRKFVK